MEECDEFLEYPQSFRSFPHYAPSFFIKHFNKHFTPLSKMFKLTNYLYDKSRIESQRLGYEIFDLLSKKLKRGRLIELFG